MDIAEIAEALPESCKNYLNGEGRKEMFYLTTHSTHFYLRLYGVRHMVKDHSDSEKGNPLPPHRLLFPININGSFIMHHPTDRIAHTTAFVTPVLEPMKDRSNDPSHHERTLLPQSYISLRLNRGVIHRFLSVSVTSLDVKCSYCRIFGSE